MSVNEQYENEWNGIREKYEKIFLEGVKLAKEGKLYGFFRRDIVQSAVSAYFSLDSFQREAIFDKSVRMLIESNAKDRNKKSVRSNSFSIDTYLKDLKNRKT